MTVYKQNELLESAIKSVLNQSHRNLELIIVDDCSPDDVHSFLENMATTDDRIKVHRMKKTEEPISQKITDSALRKGNMSHFMTPMIGCTRKNWK